MTSVKENEKTVEDSLRSRYNKNLNKRRKKEIEEPDRDLIRKAQEMTQEKEKKKKDQGST